ncbi:pentapeptide repeat-containing protein [Lentzea cavernae]|uniref:Pentapeptide repeat-containing protein n=1 Tax=Lentzea cavernae TaxID=2020703 RepID=A0ABQ3MHA6_9PSEU|nr:pentapeptide repeat-containing protein [Lentzea cavernae]GHH42103.1 hypothetical protein GCM10017774_37800 [Lentzea cavernae]
MLCAYLRMPFEIPLTSGEVVQLGPDTDSYKRAYDRNRVLVEEREVRLTAQRILTSHLPAAAGSNTVSWGEYGLDLSGAVLFDLDLSGRCLHDAVFHSTRFVGVTRFDDAIFAGVAKFGRARFDGLAFLKRTTFRFDVSFYNARFISGARLAGATFEAAVNFTEAVFGNNPGLNAAIYKGHQPVLHGVTITEHGENGEFYMPVEPSFPAGWEVVDEKQEDDGRRLLQTLGRHRKPAKKDSGPTSESDTPRAEEDPPASSAPA